MSDEEMEGEWNAITSLETLPKAIKEAEALIRKSERENCEADINELKGLLEDVFWQACGETDDRFDTLGLSAYEAAARYFKRIGRADYNGRTGRFKPTEATKEKK